MVTAGDGLMAPYKSGGAGEKFHKRPFQPCSTHLLSSRSDLISSCHKNSTGMSSDEGGNSVATGISELEQMSKQVTITRSRFKHPATMEDLPDELLINIFIRLLARQLAQMRSVSKSWNALLSHPSFVKSHLHYSIENNNEQIILVFPNWDTPFIQYSCKSPHIEPTSFIKHIPINLPMSWVIGSVNGLICLSELYYSNIHIWNPSLSAISAIPPPHSLSVVSIIPSPRHCMSSSMRFGFDPKTDDYKLVNISGICDNNCFSVKEWLQVEVYSMRKESWEFITQPFPSHISSIYNPTRLYLDGHDGHLHWQNNNGPLREHTIVGFDLGSDTFHEIPLPDSIRDSKHGWHQLEVLNGKVCEMSRRMDGAWEVWVMEEYGLPESWVIRHIFPQFKGDWAVPYGFTSRNELLVEDRDDHLVLYDPIAEKTKSTRTQQKVFRIMEYVDSLVWI